MVSISLQALVRQWLPWWNSPAAFLPSPVDFDGFHTLSKASEDTWDYAFGLRGGLVVLCGSIKRRGDIIELCDIKKVANSDGRETLEGDMLWNRGMEVRLSAVEWAADCGS